ncbi:hypothetical protein AB5I39_06070 [Sphingomonas sp. MMS24-J45]|uniref:hypothetical protein n=1 Tax=Sphingomonas sp. MMS24-J45 TaxID=3238806 RepID=UPI003850C786
MPRAQYPAILPYGVCASAMPVPAVTDSRLWPTRVRPVAPRAPTPFDNESVSPPPANAAALSIARRLADTENPVIRLSPLPPMNRLAGECAIDCIVTMPSIDAMLLQRSV